MKDNDLKQLFVCILFSVVLSLAYSARGEGIRKVNATLVPEDVQGVPVKRIYLSSSSSIEAQLLDLRKKLIERGAQKVNYFVPSLLVFEMPVGRGLEELFSDPDYTIIEEGQIGARASKIDVHSPAWVKKCYAVANREPRVDADYSMGESIDDGFEDVVLVISDSDIERIRASSPHDFGVEGLKDFRRNSEFMIGDILVQLIFPESNGVLDENTEDWSDAELSSAASGAVAAMLSFQQKFAYIPIHMVFRTFDRVPTRYEPIYHNMNDDYLWVTDAMVSLGVMEGEDAGAVHVFNSAAKRRYGTDWVFTAFTANSENSPLHRFRGAGYTAYAYLGGPYLVMPYPAGENPFDIDETLLYSQIFQHEVGHIFWATDEYPSALGRCDGYSGYLNVRNLNKRWYDDFDGSIRSCQEVVPCLMDRAKEDLDRPICGYTAGQMGLVLASGTSIPKIFNSAPIIKFAHADVETVEANEFTIRLKAISTAVPNRNPVHEKEERIDYAAPLKDAIFNIDGAGEVKILPDDGKWDEVEEDLTIRLISLRPGLTRVGVSARNSFGVSSPFFIKKIFNTGLYFAQFVVDEHEDGINFGWKVVGETFDAVFDLHRIDPGPAQQDRIIVQDIAPTDRINEQFLGFSYFDRDVIPGEKYRYYVVGTFTLERDGILRIYTSSSNIIEATAMIPIGKGDIVSHPAPNPFNPANGKLAISIDVPKSFVSEQGGMSPMGGYPNVTDTDPIMGEIETKVDVDIYDVLGHRIKKLHSQRAYSGVITIKWDGTDDRNKKISNGVYFIKVQAGSITDVRKVLILR